MKKRIKSITLNFFTKIGIQNWNAIKLINNQQYLQDLLEFTKNWVANNPNYNKKV
jgi:hypothetical protein